MYNRHSSIRLTSTISWHQTGVYNLDSITTHDTWETCLNNACASTMRLNLVKKPTFTTLNRKVRILCKNVWLQRANEKYWYILDQPKQSVSRIISDDDSSRTYTIVQYSNVRNHKNGLTVISNDCLVPSLWRVESGFPTSEITSGTSGMEVLRNSTCTRIEGPLFGKHSKTKHCQLNPHVIIYSTVKVNELCEGNKQL